MKTASPALVALLDTGEFQQADLYTFTYAGGGTLRITTADTDVSYNGNVWSSKGPYIDTPGNRSVGHWKVGLDVDSWPVEITPRPTDPITGAAFPDKIGNAPWLAAARVGALDGAEVQVDRAYWPNWPQPWQAPLLPTAVLSDYFVGRVSQVEITRTSALVTINSHLELLTMLMPRNLFQSGCAHTLFDAGCTLNPANFLASGNAIAGSTQTVLKGLPAQFSPQGSGTYALGRIVMTGGANAGFSRLVKSYSLANGIVSLTLLAPLPFPVVQGDAFTAYSGCDKQMATCIKFNNLINFGGTPYIPAPETAI